jgi:hypothetical protein
MRDGETTMQERENTMRVRENTMRGREYRVLASCFRVLVASSSVQRDHEHAKNTMRERDTMRGCTINMNEFRRL